MTDQIAGSWQMIGLQMLGSGVLISEHPVGRKPRRAQDVASRIDVFAPGLSRVVGV
jgi:hypothetical protein